MADLSEDEKGDIQHTLAQSGFRPLSRTERRNIWLHDYEAQDIALQAWVRLVEQDGLEIEIMLQMQGLLIFGTMVSVRAYAQFYIDLHEQMYRRESPETADFLQEYYAALVPPAESPDFGPEGLPVMFRYAHLRDVTIMSAGHKVSVPHWRGKVNEVDAFVIGASASE
jgi:hypothetical protein